MSENAQQKAKRLRAELALAKKESEGASLQEATELLEGRAYVFNGYAHHAVAVSIVLYSGVKRDAFGLLSATEQSLCAVKYEKPLGYEIRRNKLRYARTFASAGVLLMDSVGEMPKSEFEKAWRGAANLGACVFRWLSTVSAVNIRNTEPYDPGSVLRDTESEIDDIDIPVLHLEPCDYRMLPARFQLPGRRYILTPASIQAGLAALRDEEQGLARGSHLYQVCDMGYVPGMAWRIARLRAALQAKLP